MMKRISLTVLLCLSLFIVQAQNKPQGIPHIVNNGGYPEMMVDGKPFMILGGELGNSSASDMAYMAPIWPKVKKMHLNTLISPVYWEEMEPQEGKFDFSLLDGQIRSARINHIKLVLLWFGTWKNSMSCYVPGWMKTDDTRFPRMRTAMGEAVEVITPFSKNALEVDKKAFAALLQHIKTTDGIQHTVLMVQVENEIGMVFDGRDRSKLADKAFAGTVPAKLLTYLTEHKDSLSPEIKERWEANGFKTSGTWEEVFGKDVETDEIFMAWYFAAYANEVAKTGKAIYDLPMYVNAALITPGKKGGVHTAGPLPRVFDIWKAATPDINMLSPDFYNPDFKYWNKLFARSDNLLFIPEHKFEDGDDAKAFYVIGHYNGLGFSPFSIESTTNPGAEPIGKAYEIISQLSGEIDKAKKRKSIEGVLLSKDSATVQIEMGDYILTVSHEYTLGWSPGANDANWPLIGGIILGLSDGEFYVAGTGIVVTFKPKTTGAKAGIYRVDEGIFVNGKWQPGRRMNGDQDHQGRHLRIPVGEYSIQRIKLYTYQ